jgi:hypothetical protein
LADSAFHAGDKLLTFGIVTKRIALSPHQAVLALVFGRRGSDRYRQPALFTSTSI